MTLVETLRQQIGLIYLLIVCAYSLWRGGKPERIGAIALLAACLATPFLVNTRDWFSPQYAILGVDSLFLLVMLWLVAKSRRQWPVWAAAFTALSVVMHFTILIDRTIWPQAYLTIAGVWTVLIIASLGVGTFLEAPKRKGRAAPKDRPPPPLP